MASAALACSFEGKGEDPQKDCCYYSISERISACRCDHREQGRTVISMHLSESSMASRNALQRSVFVLDTSGSMSGEKIYKAKAALSSGDRSRNATVPT